MEWFAPDLALLPRPAAATSGAAGAPAFFTIFSLLI
jgi:hypothetical protein